MRLNVIVTGSIADGRIVSLSEHLNKLSERINSEDDLELIKYSYETSQISFHTQKSLDCIEFKSCGIINSWKEVDWYE